MKDFILKAINFIMMIGAFAYLGARCPMIAEENAGQLQGIVVFAIAFVGIYFIFLIQIIVHEGGHLAAGLLTGYKFVSFRIGSFVWVKNKEDKIELRKMKVQGTAGQCLMCPPDVPVENCPYKLYHMAGGLANIVLGVIGIVLAIFLPKNIWTFVLCEEVGVLGMALGLTNLIPGKSGGIQNDGYNLIDLGRDQIAKRCLNLVLTMNAILTVADSYEELPRELVDEIKSIDFTKLDLSNSSIANAFNYQAGLYYVEGNYEKAYEMQKFISESEDVLPIFQNEAKCECLFFEIVSGADSDVIEHRYDAKLDKYIKATSIYPSRQRLLYAYYTLYHPDEKKAEEAMKKLEKMVDTFMIKADAVLELAVAKNLTKKNECE